MTMTEFAQMLWTAMRGGQRVLGGVAGESHEELAVVMTMARGGTIRAVVDQTFALSEIRAAHARVDSGRKVGAVVVLPGGRGV